jgi:hypothetical protein
MEVTIGNLSSAFIQEPSLVLEGLAPLVVVDHLGERSNAEERWNMIEHLLG